MKSASSKHEARSLSPFAAAMTCAFLSGAVWSGWAQPSTARAQQVSGAAPGQRATATPPRFGPYNGQFLPGGSGLRIPVADKADTLLAAESPWTVACWFQASGPVEGLEVLAGVGDVSGEYNRFLAIGPGRLELRTGLDALGANTAVFQPGTWHLAVATSDGERLQLYADGKAVAEGSLPAGAVSPVLQMAPPRIMPWQGGHFGGRIAGFTVLRQALTAAEVVRLAQTPPRFDDLAYEEGSKPWPLQTRGQAGYRAPQPPEEMPTSRAPFSQPVALKRAESGPSLQESGPREWTFADGWTLRPEPEVHAAAGEIASPALPAGGWLRATVPGTVLTSMVEDGLYPDPYYGLNNLAIPETLNKQAYWYRNVFVLPASIKAAVAAGQRVQVNFAGINYHAEIWLNGKRLGEMKGAFRRGQFDASAALLPEGRNGLAVRIEPPPHPGIPQEQSILGGAGENGGAMALDGPTFIATEGWDWVPAIRDRDSGLWQPVTLSTSGPLRLGDVQVISRFAQHDTSRAALEVRVPVSNGSGAPRSAVITVRVEDIRVSKAVTVPPGESSVVLSPAEYPELNLQHPRLWWPNGYGKPELYTAEVSVADGAGSGPDSAMSDRKRVRFGVREISYELSLLDSTGVLRRVLFTPAAAQAGPGPASQGPIVDVSHAGMRQIPSADAPALGVAEAAREQYPYQSFVSSLAPGAERSPAIEPSADMGTAPYLVLVVNGVRIAARGGNWGMDDAMKRVSREHLEPYFRLQRNAHMNIIRNWMGQDTEESFYDLADEYGMMVWNDFWESTQNYNLEAEDPALFLANARDVMEHFRNHPSIVLWCGRNEGVPQPILNQGLEELARTLDGTRFYSPSSNQVNLQGSGPYSYQDPALYYTSLNRGFSVETGTPSLSTLESLQSSIPPADQWPMDDVWAYHDWHFSGNGRMQPFMQEIEAEFGAGTGLADFERKAQMLNYVDHRAIFEGMNANLWQPNSGRMLWMTQPAWPSNVWQILSSDYDTQASFYGAQKGAEPLHVQLNLANHQVDVVNTTTEAQAGLRVSARVVSLKNEPLAEAHQTLDLPADGMAHAMMLPLAPLLDRGMVLVELTLAGQDGQPLSRNLYWLGRESSQYRQLGSLPTVPLRMVSSAARDGQEMVLTVDLANPAAAPGSASAAPALNSKLTLLDSGGQRILPAYYSDNYVSLLPGETEHITIRFPATAAGKGAVVALRGWNVQEQRVTVPLPR